MMEQVLNFFVSNAYADPVAATSATQGGSSLMPMMVVFLFFIYFAIWLPQSKRAKEQRDMLGTIAKGDEIITAGGLLGRITKIADPYIVMSINDNVEITVQKSSIVNVLPKGTIKSIA